MEWIAQADFGVKIIVSGQFPYPQPIPDESSASGKDWAAGVLELVEDKFPNHFSIGNHDVTLAEAFHAKHGQSFHGQHL
ncbi:hypothetical protein NUU61_009090 [Penicillium alfredii]|uniref:Calcineurin-like phosphoesterase domain-containing protein n=1 Tax=Penicillium alfredii TaxID=1506179 RepID=A0A9W9JX20_9EURO|nr:uncharacterized protein NUU61_009090 [Penicillium alfredii]KAJ5084511.1 hypothetical protein NUU61_009090 [Penicillium alfredii]